MMLKETSKFVYLRVSLKDYFYHNKIYITHRTMGFLVPRGVEGSALFSRMRHADLFGSSIVNSLGFAQYKDKPLEYTGFKYFYL